MKIGPGLDIDSRIGPLVSREQLDRVSGYIAIGQKQGAAVRYGGRQVGNQGYFLEPTILTNTSSEMFVVREEIFGPVLCVMSFDDDSIDAVVRRPMIQSTDWRRVYLPRM